MNIEMGILIAIVCAVISVATFFLGRQTTAEKDGQEWGELLSDVRYIKEGMSKMELNLSEDVQAMRAEIAKERDDRRRSIERVHEKLDNHIKDSHKGEGI